jgi:hypothetical protein
MELAARFNLARGCCKSGSAGFQPAVSPISNRQNSRTEENIRLKTRAFWRTMGCRLEACDTADWKSALLLQQALARVFYESRILQHALLANSLEMLNFALVFLQE